MTITLIGAGNVGHHLGKQFFKKGHVINQVYSRSLKNAKLVAKNSQASAIDDLQEINAHSDLYILAVKDDVIKEVAKQCATKSVLANKLFVHTSGAVSSTVLQPYFKHYGVFYPLQTFSKKKRISFKQLPICIDAKKKKDKRILIELGNTISKSVHEIKDQERATLHVAAVFVNNFTNHLFHIAEKICKQEQIDFSILQPLIEETVKKIKHQSPIVMQTGPAKRGDHKTIQKHLAYLDKTPAIKRVYQMMTDLIYATYFPEK